MAVSFCLSVEAGSRENCSSDCHRWIRLEPLPPTTVSRAKGEREPDGCLRNLHAKEEFATPFCSPPSILPPLSLFILLLSLDKKLLPWFDEIRRIKLFTRNSWRSSSYLWTIENDQFGQSMAFVNDNLLSLVYSYIHILSLIFFHLSRSPICLFRYHLSQKRDKNLFCLTYIYILLFLSFFSGSSVRSRVDRRRSVLRFISRVSASLSVPNWNSISARFSSRFALCRWPRSIALILH